MLEYWPSNIPAEVWTKQGSKEDKVCVMIKMTEDDDTTIFVFIPDKEPLQISCKVMILPDVYQKFIVSN